MFPKIILLLLVILSLLILPAEADCTAADSYECSTSLCANFYVLNGTCKTNSAAASCSPNKQVYFRGACVNCQTLAQENCTSVCPDYYYSSSCKACWTSFGSNCVACTSQICTYCAYSSGTVLSSDSKSCVSSTCSISNCQKCYNHKSVARCQKCKTGFTVDSQYNCVPSTCTITYCTTCKDSEKCAACTTNYKLSNDQTGCIPTCNDTNCLTCLKPNYCGTCVSGYNAKNGVCMIDCSKSLVANCKTCLTMATCIECKENYILANGGASCIVKCNDSNCDYCISAASCLTCKKGYSLNNNSVCTRNICPVHYCQTCLNVKLCESCITDYILSDDKRNCLPSCASTITNCVRCSNPSTCAYCSSGYQLVSNRCDKLCSIGNCSTCATSTTCSLCQAKFALSQDKTACNLICLVSNCASCDNATSCKTCADGYNKRTSGSKDFCLPACGPGQINTGVSDSPVCQPCSTSIANCMNCHLTSSSEVVCDTCPTGFFVDGAGNCQLCSTQLDSCWTCQDPSTCTQCVFEYRLKDGVCEKYRCDGSVLNCDNCNQDTPSKCETCQSGFTLNSITGSCQVFCSPTYVFDFDLSACVCASGTYESEATCLSCADTNCQSCSMAGCDYCNEGYFLSGNVCQECSINCIECSSAITCLSCQDGYSVAADGSCISAPGCAPDQNGGYYPCPTGCSTCQISANGEPICSKAADGYSIVASSIIACDSSCRACSDTTNNSCTACYPSQYLIGGQCKSCSDPFATACLQGNPSFSTKCQSGYTPSFYTSGSTSIGGSCKACASNCIQCDSAGPGNCDSGKCATAFVIIVGTTNCTACIGGCPQCSSYNPGECLKCPDGQYSQLSTGLCQPCTSTCATCTDNSTCSSCNSGSSLIGGKCLSNPSNCLAMLSEKICGSCVQGYVLSDDKSACNIDNSCNGTSKCFVCSNGQYLRKGQCFTCSNLPANCLTCQSNSKCIKCGDGYFVDDGACSKCADNCLKCTTTSFCIQPAQGYYVQLGNNRKKNGIHSRCRSPCKTCDRDEKNCLSCEKGYTLNGTQCLGDSRVIVRLLIKSDGSAGSILNQKASAAQTLYSGASNINRLYNSLCKMLPSKFEATTLQKCYDVLKLSFLGSGSIAIGNSVVGGGYSSADEALNAITSSFRVGSSLDGGLALLSSSFQATGNYTQTNPVTPPISNSPNLGLILGLSIPLTALLILIIAVVALRNKAPTVEMAEREGVADSADGIQRPELEKV